MNEEVRHFSLRKLSVGLASVLVGVSIFGASQTVKADSVADSQASSLTNNAQLSDTQENENATKSTFSDNEQGNSVKNNATQTQDETKNDQKQDQIKNGQQPTANYQETNDINDLDAGKNAVRTGSLPKANNQSNNQPEGNSQAQPQNSPKLAKKVLTTNLIATPPTTNGGFDEATWGKLDVNNWQGQAENGVYQLTSYTGDVTHIIVPNEADFEQAGKSTNGLQVGITSDTVQSILARTNQEQTAIAFSKTKGEKIKAIGTDWSNAFSDVALSKFDGSNLDVSNVTDMNAMFRYANVSDLTSLANWDTSEVTSMTSMFQSNSINDLTPLAHWNTNKVTDMTSMFAYNKVSDLTPLAHWNTSNVTGMSSMFRRNKVSDLTPLAHWDTSQVASMSDMFESNQISDLTPLANWDTSQVTSTSSMFEGDKVSDLTPLAHWDTSNVTNMSSMFEGDKVSDLTPLANWDTSNVTDMSSMFEGDKVSDLTPLAHWDTSNVTNMSSMFYFSSISDLSPLAHWDVSNVTDMNGMFGSNKVGDLTPLKNWDTSKVTNMRYMFGDNKISDLTSLANWNTSNVTDMSRMFAENPDLIDLKPIANWNISSVKRNNNLFDGDTKLDLTNINNTPLMQSFLKTPKALQGATFITNNTDFVKAVVGQDLPTLTNTAKRTIVFNIPHAAPETIVQIINYKALAPVQIGWSSSIGGGGWSGGAGSSTIIGGGGSSSGGGFHYTLGGGGFSSGTGSSTVVGGSGSSSGSGTGGVGGSHNIISHRMRMVFASVGTPFQTDSDDPKIIKTYSAKDLKASDWQLDDSKPNDAVIVNGQIRFKPVKIPHVSGYKARIRKNPINPAMLMVSFVAIPSENMPSLPDKEKPSKPIEDTPSKPSAPVNSANKSADDLQKRVVTELNSNDSGWTMPNIQPATYTVEMPADNTIDLSNLVIAEPVHAQTRMQIHVTKHFKLRKHGKKHVVKRLKHRKKTVRQFNKYRL